jgi:hypothetical protein
MKPERCRCLGKKGGGPATFLLFQNQSLTNAIKRPTVYYPQRIEKTIIKADRGTGAFVNGGGKAVWTESQGSLVFGGKEGF